MARSGNGRSGGRIRAADRQATDDAETIGADIEISEEHQANVKETNALERKVKTRREHCNRLKRYAEWLKQNYPQYVSNGGVKDLTEEELNNPDLFFYKMTQDLEYKGFNTKLFEAFLGVMKKKANGKTCSHEHVRKFVDAVKWGASQRNDLLPREFYVKTDRYLANFKKELAEAKEKGNADEKAADPIPTPLYVHILEWAVSAGNIFLWTFTVLQWNCLGRAISIDPLALHNFRRGQSDSIAARYDSSKPDQEGEFVNEKNLYANPFKPVVCPVLALGIWLCIEQQRFIATERIFLGAEKDAKKGSAAHSYHEQLKKLITEHIDVVGQYVRKDRANGHGFRKGGAVHASSGTTFPASFTSVASRGEWSISKVLDQYFQWAATGDHQLGRSMCLLDPNHPNFAVLPPHWTDEALGSEAIDRAMAMCFGDILDAHGESSCDPRAVLSLCLASIVHHSDWLLSTVADHSGHPFSRIPILNDTDLLDSLKACVTLEPSKDVPNATGVPPHIHQAKIIQEILAVAISTKEDIAQLKEAIVEAIGEAIDEKAAQVGNLTKSVVENMLKAMEERVLARMDDLQKIRPQEGAAPPHPATIRREGPALFNYIPSCFLFPANARRWSGWIFWLKGMQFPVRGDAGDEVVHTIRPFREFETKMLPSKAARDDFKNNWAPILRLMEAAPGVAGTIPKDPRNISDEFVQSSFDKATEYLKSRASYIWSLPNSRPENWSLGYWSKMTKRSKIMKAGTPSDKANCPPPTARNQPHGAKRTIAQRAKNPSIRRRLASGSRSTCVGGNRSTGIGGNRSTAVGGTCNRSTGIGGNRSTGIGGNRSTAVGGTCNRSTGIGGNRSTGIRGNRSDGSGSTHSRSTGSSSRASTSSNGCEFENVPGRRACLYPAEAVEGVFVPPLDACKCKGEKCSHVAGGCKRRFHHSCGAALEHDDERFESLGMGRFCPQCMHNMCGVAWGAMASAAPESLAVAGDDDFMSSFQMDAEVQANLLNSRLSKDVEEEAKIELEAEMAEDAAEAGRVAGGDGDGNALYVVGGKKRSGGGSSDKKKRRRGRYK